MVLEISEDLFNRERKRKISMRGVGETSQPFPPNTADMRILAKDLEKSIKFTTYTSGPLPTSYNISEKLGDLTQNPRAQHTCGSCYAFAIATAMNDAFAYKNNEWANISVTSIMRVAKNHAKGLLCDGGFISRTLEALKIYGVQSNTCFDYSWCSKNSSCIEGAGFADLNELVPKIPNSTETKFCYLNSEDNRHVFRIEEYDSLVTKPNDDDTIAKNVQNNAKLAIMTNGSLIGGIVVWRNFYNGLFKETEGIYMENRDYENGGYLSNFPSETYYRGMHAICVVGWGESEKEIEYKDIDGNIRNSKIPYWIIRNSWGSGWGDKGFCKYAMYPYNPFSLLDKTCLITPISKTSYITGGMYMIKKIVYSDIPIDKTSNYSGPYNQLDEYYKSDKLLATIPSEDNRDEIQSYIIGKEEKTSYTLYYILGAIIGAVVIYMIMKKPKVGKAEKEK